MKLAEIEIEEMEYKYFSHIFNIVNSNLDFIIKSFLTKEDIRSDWVNNITVKAATSAIGAERVFYTLFNGFGIPNTSPVASDLFYETEDAFVHIDIKTVTTTNRGDMTNKITIGENQHSYYGRVLCNNSTYKGNLPYIYTKSDGSKKICLTYFLGILHDYSDSNIERIVLASMPNGLLKSNYAERIIGAGKNPGQIRYLYNQKFEYLNNTPDRFYNWTF